MTTYILIGVIAVIGSMVAINLIFESNLNKKSRKVIGQKKNLEVNRKLKLIVVYDFGETSKLISEKPTSGIIISTMKSIDWEKFHVVYLEDENGNMMDVSGSLFEDGLASGFVNDNVHLLKVNPINSVEEMTGILIDFLKGEDFWKNKHKYE